MYVVVCVQGVLKTKKYDKYFIRFYETLEKFFVIFR